MLVTGHTGFKGSWLTSWLVQLGAIVMGVALPRMPTSPSLFEQLEITGIVDLRADVTTTSWMGAAVEFAPEVVFHLAAQSLVSVGYLEPFRTFEVNVLGTARVMDFLASLDDLRAAVIVTTDKVYAATDSSPHSEASTLGGRDPYSASKAASEMVVGAWPRLAAPCVTARAGNVIGGGDWAANRLLPDIVRAWFAGSAISLRHPLSIRPWQHVLEPLRGYLLYAEALGSGLKVPTSLNFGPSDPQGVQVRELVEFAAVHWTELGLELPSPPFTVLTEAGFAETEELTLDSGLAASQLGWSSVLDWRQAVMLTIEWYAGVEAGARPGDLVRSQLDQYVSLLDDAK